MLIIAALVILAVGGAGIVVTGMSQWRNNRILKSELKEAREDTERAKRTLDMVTGALQNSTLVGSPELSREAESILILIRKQHNHH